MVRRNPTYYLLFLCLLFSVALPGGLVGAKGKAPQSGAVNVQIKIKIAKEFPDFPLPLGAERVAKEKQKAPRGWVEYRVLGFSPQTLVAFYQQHMPGRGWKLGHYKGNTWVWRRGPREITVVFFQLGPVCLIQVREIRR